MNDQTLRLRDLCKPYFDLGAAITPRNLRSHAELLEYEFNSLTAENCMKPALIQPVDGAFDFEAADEILGFARSRGYRMRGHTLVWHQQTPPWFFQDEKGNPVTRTQAMWRLEQHIHSVVGHFRGAVDAWDVVNEAVDDKGPMTWRDTPCFRAMGEDYVAHAFRTAHVADPACKLFYNDYNEVDEPKRSRIVGALRKLLDDGVPIHGMGMQGHYGPHWPTLDAVSDSIEAYKSLGLEVEITELDVSMYSWHHGPSPITSPTPEMLEHQAQRYAGLFEVFRDHGVKRVTLWGVADDYSWLDHFPEPNRKNWPLLFDAAHRPKPAYDRIAGLIKDNPHATRKSHT